MTQREGLYRQRPAYADTQMGRNKQKYLDLTRTLNGRLPSRTPSWPFPLPAHHTISGHLNWCKITELMTEC